ncbi:MAG: Rpp14/Pop5 family protein [Candidatus Bathyarchaeia archaeon]
MVKVDCDKAPSERSFQSALWYSVIRLFGEYGASQADISLIEYNEEMKYAIIRCSHKALPTVRASIAAVTRVDGEDATMHVLLTSGTLKALRRRIPSVLYGKNEKEK